MDPSYPTDLVEPIVHGLRRRFPFAHLHVVVDLARAWPRPDLEAAVAALLSAFPVLGCTYRSGWWRDRWVREPLRPADLVEVSEVAAVDLDDATRRLVRRPLDLERAPPFRLVSLAHGAGSRLMITLHHQAADGAGALAATHLLAASLAGTALSLPVSTDRRVGQVLRHVRLRDWPVIGGELARELFQPLAMLRVRRRDRPFPAEEPGFGAPQWRSLVLDAEQRERLAARCREGGATINDALLAALARLAATRTAAGPVAVGYTIDLRRFLPAPRLLVGNFAGVALVVLPRFRVAPYAVLAAVVARTRSQKQRFPGLAYNLLPLLTMGWLPAGLLRRLGRRLFYRLVAWMARALVVTNVGPLDDALAPLGDDVRHASVLGPFLAGVGAPVVTASGFRGSLTLQVGACDDLSAAGLAAYCREIGEALADLTAAGSPYGSGPGSSRTSTNPC